MKNNMSDTLNDDLQSILDHGLLSNLTDEQRQDINRRAVGSSQRISMEADRKELGEIIEDLWLIESVIDEPDLSKSLAKAITILENLKGGR